MLTTKKNVYQIKQILHNLVIFKLHFTIFIDIFQNEIWVMKFQNSKWKYLNWI